MTADESNTSGCCAPRPGAGHSNDDRSSVALSGDTRALGISAGSARQTGVATADNGASFIRIPGGRFWMGAHDPAAHPADGEGPVREVLLDGFEIDAFAVSNARFKAFVAATGYVTEAERFGWSIVFSGFVDDPDHRLRTLPASPWWKQVFGACWHAPEGSASSIDGRENHPAVHISYADAQAYCAWSAARLPTEAEWECAARGGLVQQRYPWGNDLTPDGQHRCNIWQGTFPRENLAEDGYAGTAPVDVYQANGFGLHNVVGNTWEWCQDWFSPDHHARASLDNPQGPPKGHARVIRGGSYLCHDSYCFRYRVSARSSVPPDTSTGHLGFRIARSL